MGADKEINEFEKETKENLFSKIVDLVSKQSKVISEIEKNMKEIGQQNEKIPNTGITLNNKLAEISKEFKDAGISMFASKPKYKDEVSSSFIGNAIINELVSEYETSSQKLKKYDEDLSIIVYREEVKNKALKPFSPIIRIFQGIRSFFVKEQVAKPSILSKEDEKILETSLKEYREIDSNMFNYSLEKDLVSSLVKEIAGQKKSSKVFVEHCYQDFVVPNLVKEDVIPDLKKLGLEKLIPELQKKLSEAYGTNFKDFEEHKKVKNDMESSKFFEGDEIKRKELDEQDGEREI